MRGCIWSADLCCVCSHTARCFVTPLLLRAHSPGITSRLARAVGGCSPAQLDMHSSPRAHLRKWAWFLTGFILTHLLPPPSITQSLAVSLTHWQTHTLLLLLQDPGYVLQQALEAKSAPSKFKLLDQYAGHLRQQLVGAIDHPQHREKPLSGLKIVVDAGNGSGGFFASQVCLSNAALLLVPGQTPVIMQQHLLR